ncbi:MAG: fibronectin type III domain-containing protein [Candidatus Latescibacteria bacterium]|nr:fibronectin type III domain-containing protein [Candidatus Latescibacterota bacterium]
MISARSYPGRLLLIAAVFAAWTTAASAGSNAGFTASVTGPVEVRNPQIGQVVNLTISVQGTQLVKGNVVKIRYDSTYFSFLSYSPGNITSGLLIPLNLPPTLADGLTQVEGGSTLFSNAQAKTGGTLGTFSFQVIGQVPVQGTYLSVVEVEVNASSADKDILEFNQNTFGVKALYVFPNALFGFAVERFHDRAVVAWTSRNRGFDDQVQYRPLGATEWQSAGNPLKTRFPADVAAAVKTLRTADIDPVTADSLTIQRALGGTALAPGFLPSLRELAKILDTRVHRIPLAGLQANTRYEYRASSVGLLGQQSDAIPGTFLTRGLPDLRPMVLNQVDVQPGPNWVVLRWFTDRPADTRYAISLRGDAAGSSTLRDTLDEEGANAHIVLLENLLPDTTYTFTVSSRRIGADGLVSAGQLLEARTKALFSGIFRTRGASRSLRLTGPPIRVVGTTTAAIDFQLSQGAQAYVDFGPVSTHSAKVTQETQVEDSLYTETVTSGQVLTRHSLTLSNLDPSTRYRYRIRASTPRGDSLNTDPRGNYQWSRDLQFATTAAADTLPPVIVEGPQVFARNQVGVISWVTDVETTGKIFFGTLDSTGLGSANEIEIVDLAANGNPRFAHRHVVTLTGLTRSTTYGYRVEATAANGKTVLFDPTSSAAAAKPTRILQPPGGSGSFVTSNLADTQYPVLLTGPTLTAKTHDTAVVEWTTDEPANSEVQFGVESLDESSSSGDNETRHKMTLSDLTPGTSYTYQVGSTDASGNGATQSAKAIFATAPEVDLTAPAILSGPEVIYKSDKSATIQWTTDEDATAEVEFGTSAALGFVRSLSTTAQVHEVTLTNLNPGTAYSYKVSSEDLSNNGPTESAVLSFTTDSQSDLASPVISGTSASPSDTYVIIHWNTDEVANSFVDYGTDQVALDSKVGDTENELEHEIVLTNLSKSTKYYYTVGSIDPANNPLSQSQVLEFTTLAVADLIAPATPAGLAGAAGSGEVRLSWTGNTEADLGGYRLYRRSGSGDFAAIATNLSQTSYTDQGLSNGTAYEYRLSATDRNPIPNESALSTAVSVTPTASAAPSAPTGLTRQGEILQPTLVFANATPVRAGATLTYTLQVSTQSDFSDVTSSTSGLAESSGDAGTGRTAWTLPRTLEDGQTYYWKVRAVEGVLAGPYSETQQFTAQASLAGDFDGDNSVTFDDFFLFVDVFGQTTTSSNSKFDLDEGGTIDFSDFFLFVDNFGKSISAKRWAASRELDTWTRLSVEALAAPGDPQIAVRVRADQVDALKAFGLVLNYDPQVVEFLSADQGSASLLESKGGQSPLFRVLSQAPGELVIGNGLTAGEPVSGQGLLAELQFRPLGGLRTTRFELREAFVHRAGDQPRQVQQVGSAQLLPRVYSLGANFPNPFNPTTTITYALPQAGPAELRVYDVLGQQIRTLVARADHPAGFYTTTWDGLDSAGRPVGNGLYFYRLEAGAFTQVRKMMMIK